jgi:tetratricopeptide (TPR) repeat protein
MRTVKFLIMLALVLAIGCGGSTALRSGKTYYHQHKDYAQAENAFRQAVNEEPDNWEAYYYLALSLAQQEKYSEARGYFEKARELAPDDEKRRQVKEHQRSFFADHAKRGITALSTSNYEEAVRQFEEAVAVYNEDPVGYVNLGVAYSHLEPSAEIPDPNLKAREAFMKSVEIDPTYVEGWRNLGINYRNSGDFEKAREAFAKIVEIDPEDLDALLSVGDMSFNLKDYEKALESYQEAAELEKGDALLYYNIGTADFQLGRYEEAGRAFQNAAALAQGKDQALYEDAMFNLGFSYMKLKNYDSAITTYKALVEVNDKPEYHEMLGSAYSNAGMSDEAVAEFRRADELRGQ